MAYKRGRWSKKETDYMKENVDKFSIHEMGKHLNRNPENILTYLHENGYETDEVQTDLTRRPVWKVLETQFNEEELRMFQYEWDRLYTQFKGDVLPTEETQMMDAIKLEIMMNRNLSEQQEIAKLIEKTKADLKLEEDLGDNADRDTTFNLERQIASLSSASSSLNRDYRDMQDKKGKLLGSMKGTRDQRIKRIESGNESYPVWMAKIVDNTELRRKLGIKMEKMRVAAQKEASRLSEYHKYEDGTVDQPLLTPDTIKDDNV